MTIATASTVPRAEEMRTFSPLAMPFSFASSSLISTYAWGWASTSHGCQRVNAPVHQCSVQEYVVITSGKSGDALAIGFMSLPKLWRAGLTRWADMMFFLKGLSIGS